MIEVRVAALGVEATARGEMHAYAEIVARRDKGKWGEPIRLYLNDSVTYKETK